MHVPTAYKISLIFHSRITMINQRIVHEKVHPLMLIQKNELNAGDNAIQCGSYSIAVGLCYTLNMHLGERKEINDHGGDQYARIRDGDFYCTIPTKKRS